MPESAIRNYMTSEPFYAITFKEFLIAWLKHNHITEKIYFITDTYLPQDILDILEPLGLKRSIDAMCYVIPSKYEETMQKIIKSYENKICIICSEDLMNT